MNKKVEWVIKKHLAQSEWKPTRVVSDLVKTGMNHSDAEMLMQANTPKRKDHKPHNSHAKPVHLEDLSVHYIVVGDFNLLDSDHQDALVAAVRNSKGKSSLRDEAVSVTLFNLVKAYPVITTAEVNKFVNRGAFIDSIPLYIDGETIEGDLMPSANNDEIKTLFRAVKQLKKITDHMSDTGTLAFKKYLDRVPTDEDVARAVGIVMPVIRNPYFKDINYDRMYADMPAPEHREDTKKIIREWKAELSRKGGKSL